LSVATDEFDLVVEGMAEKVTDPATVEIMAERWREVGWPAQVDDSGVALTVVDLPHHGATGHVGSGGRPGRSDSVAVWVS